MHNQSIFFSIAAIFSPTSASFSPLPVTLLLILLLSNLSSVMTPFSTPIILCSKTPTASPNVRATSTARSRARPFWAAISFCCIATGGAHTCVNKGAREVCEGGGGGPTEVVASSTRHKEVVVSSTRQKEVVASSTRQKEVVASSTRHNKVVANSTRQKEVVASEDSQKAPCASSTRQNVAVRAANGAFLVARGAFLAARGSFLAARGAPVGPLYVPSSPLRSPPLKRFDVSTY